MDNPVKDNLLRSWKEIAVHLGVDERTCARWEQKLGMPIHRAEEGMARSRVFAYKDELDRWFKETFSAANGPEKPELAGEKRRARLPASLVALIVVLVVIAAAAFFNIKTIVRAWTVRQPVDFRIRGSVLVLLAENGRETGRFDTKVEGLEDDDYYRTFFQAVDHAKSDVRLPSLVIRDINADGKNEVLLAVQKRDDRYGEGDLFCLDGRGKRLWRYHTGREMRFGGKTYSQDYRIHGFITRDLNGDGREEVVVVAYHFPQWPCQLSVLNDRGEPLGEYWNSGQLKDVCFADLEGRGRQEMLVAGINNEHGACLIVFDPARVSGCSPQSGTFKSDDLPAGSELYYVVAPMTDVGTALRDPVECFKEVGIAENSHIVAYTQYSLGYEFDFGLKCLSVDPGHIFQSRHDELRAAGKVSSDLADPAYVEGLRKAVRYWDGEKFVPTPTPNLKNVPPVK